jgi:hypothetical protein
VIALSARRALQAQAVLSLEWPRAGPFERLCNSGVRSDQLRKARRDRVMQLVLLARSLARGVGLRTRALRRRRDRLLDYFALTRRQARTEVDFEPSGMTISPRLNSMILVPAKRSSSRELAISNDCL